MGMSRMVIGCLVLAFFLVMMAQRAEGHITFFSPQEMRALKEREGRKLMEPRSEDGQIETNQHLPKEDGAGNPEKTVEISMQLSAKQLDQVAPVLEVLQELMEEPDNAK
ncbi:motilin-like [Osmerus eperlanus]|uniref:motilin-like n=1 Tax=Osmerus eperlanus TaxID=29151 RepID=UPI002E11A52C